MTVIKRFQLLRSIADILLILVFTGVLILVTGAAVGDILYYTGGPETSFPPFSGTVLLTLSASPFLLAAAVFFFLAEKLYDRRARDGKDKQNGITQRGRIKKRAALCGCIFSVLMIITGSFVSVKMGPVSAEYITGRFRYLCQAYSPFLLLSLLLLLTSRAGAGRSAAP